MCPLYTPKARPLEAGAYRTFAAGPVGVGSGLEHLGGDGFQGCEGKSANCLYSSKELTFLCWIKKKSAPASQ